MVRFGARVALLMAVLLTAVVLGGPLVVRGPRLARFMLRLLPPTCGQVHATAAFLGPLSIVQGLTGHLFPIEIDGLTVDDPAGRRVLAAERVTARVQVRRNPWSLTIADLRVGPGTWKMLADRRAGVSLLAAFFPADSCSGARPARRPATAASGPPAELHIEHVQLVDLDITFDFVAWGLTFAHASALGEMAVAPGPDGKPQLTFDVRNVHSGPGSALRVGAPRQTWAVEVPFDDVELTRAGAPPENAADLVLEVAHARTGASDLGGTAVFRGILGRPGPAGPGRDVEAHWIHLADAAGRLRARWRPGVARGMGTEELDVGAALHGPFSGMAARLNVRAPRLELDLSLARDLTAQASLVLKGVDTGAHLPPPLRPLLGGIVTGRLRLEARLATALARASGSLVEMDLTLDRARAGTAPARWHLHKQALGAAQGPPAPRGPQPKSALDVSVAAAELRAGVMALHDLSAIIRPSGAAIHGDAALALADPETARPLVTPRLDMHLGFERLGLAILQTAALKGALSGSVAVTGPSDDLRMSLRLREPRTIKLAGLSLKLPEAARARLQHGDTFTVPPTRFEGPGGVELEAEGTLIPDKRLTGVLRARHWPLAATPLPGLAGDATRGWKGTFDADLDVAGNPRTPALSGHLDLHDIAAMGLALGEGRIAFARHGPDVKFDGQLGPHIAASGRGHLDGTTRLDASVQITDLVVDPWLRRVSRDAGATIGGDVDVKLRGGQPPAVEARLSELRARWGRNIALANQGPVVVHATPDETVVEPCTLAGSGLALSAQGRLSGATLDAEAHGTAALSTLAAMIPRGPVRLTRASGDVAVALQARGPVSAPGVDARVSVGPDPLSAVLLAPGRPATPLTLGPAVATVTLAAGGAPDVRLQRLRLATPGVTVDASGAAALDARDVWSSTGTLDVTAHVDGATLAREAPHALDRSAGTLTVRARLDGPLRAPAWRATLHAANLVIAPRKATATVVIPALQASLDGHRVNLQPFDVTLIPEQPRGRPGLAAMPLPLGRIYVGAAGRPTSIELLSLDPLEVGHVDMTLAGSGISLPAGLAGAPIHGAGFDLRLAGPNSLGWLVLGGTVTVPQAGIKPKTASKESISSSKTSALGRLLRRIWLDMRVRVADLNVQAPGPALSLRADCRIDGPLLKPKTSGSLSGLDLYSSAALFLSDVLLGTHARECRE